MQTLTVAVVPLVAGTVAELFGLRWPAMIGGIAALRWRPARPLAAIGSWFLFAAIQPFILGLQGVDTILGVAVTRDSTVAERLHFLQNAMGGVPGPFDCFLALRGLRTLPLRVGRHAVNASAVASFLAERDDIDWLSYPGLTSGPRAHPQARWPNPLEAWSR